MANNNGNSCSRSRSKLTIYLYFDLKIANTHKWTYKTLQQLTYPTPDIVDYAGGEGAPVVAGTVPQLHQCPLPRGISERELKEKQQQQTGGEGAKG